MGVAGRAHVDDVDVVAADQFARVRDGVGNVEVAGRLARAIELGVGDRDDAAARIAAIAGQVRAARPGAGPEHADANGRPSVIGQIE